MVDYLWVHDPSYGAPAIREISCGEPFPFNIKLGVQFHQPPISCRSIETDILNLKEMKAKYINLVNENFNMLTWQLLTYLNSICRANCLIHKHYMLYIFPHHRFLVITRNIIIIFHIFMSWMSKYSGICLSPLGFNLVPQSCNCYLIRIILLQGVCILSILTCRNTPSDSIVYDGHY